MTWLLNFWSLNELVKGSFYGKKIVAVEITRIEIEQIQMFVIVN